MKRILDNDDIASSVDLLKSEIKEAMAQHEAIYKINSSEAAKAHVNAYKYALKKIDECFPLFVTQGDD